MEAGTEAEAAAVEAGTEAETAAVEAGTEADPGPETLTGTEADLFEDGTEAEILQSVEELLAEVRAQAEAEKESALAQALEEAELKMQESMAEAIQTAESEKEVALAEARAAAMAEMETALAEAKADAEGKMEAALEEARAAAEAEKESALAAAALAAGTEKETALAEAKAAAEEEMAAALKEAKATAESEKEAALAAAKETAESELLKAIEEGKETAESEMEAALAAAKEAAESEMTAALEEAKTAAEAEKEAALAEAEKTAESEKQKALDDAKTAAESEMTAALAAAKETAESEMAAALEEAKTAAESDKEQALALAKETAESEMAAAVKSAQETAESEKEQLLAETLATAESELDAALNKAYDDAEQGLKDARAQWESEKESEAESERLAIEDSTIVTAADTILRSGPDSGSQALLKIREGSPVTVLSTSDEVTKVDYYGLKGYVENNALQVPNGMKEIVSSAPGLEIWYLPIVTYNSHLNVRENPGVDSQWITQLGPEQKVRGTGRFTEDGSWIEVQYDADGNTGWVCAKYTREDTEGQPDEITKLMYLAAYDKAADYLRSEKTEGVRAFQDGQETDAGFVTGFATLIADNWLYTGAVVDGVRQGHGALVGIDPEDPEGYIVITGDWKDDKVDGDTIWYSKGHKNAEDDLMIRGGVKDNYWNGDVEITGTQDGESKHYYCVAENGNFTVLSQDEDRFAIAKNPDGSYWYVDSEEELTDCNVGLIWDNAD